MQGELPAGSALPAPPPDLAEIAEKLFAVYMGPGGHRHNLNAFPRWCLSPAFLSVFAKYAASVLTFYNDDDDVELVRKLLLQREPTNIAMMRYHDVRGFAQLVASLPGGDGGWSESFYTQYWKQHRSLAPNLAVYIETPATHYDDNNTVSDFSAAEALELRVLNVIGYGFDASEQPDSLAFRDLHDGVALRRAVRRVFEKILACVEHFAGSARPVTWMHVPEFGCGAFAGDRGYEVKAIWNDCWAEFVPKWEALGCACDRGYIYTEGDFFNNDLNMHSCWRAYAQSEEHGGLANRLFVNAWDPHSFVGNANFTDASMDGYYGRCTAMALLCWPVTNPACHTQLKGCATVP